MPIRTLFMQSQSFFGADTELQVQLMRYLDRREVEVFVACTGQRKAGQIVIIDRAREISDLQVRETNFGPSLTWSAPLTKSGKVKLGMKVGRMLFGLAAYVRRNRIQIIHGTEKPRDACYGVLLGKMTGARSVVHMHVNYGDWLNRNVKWALRNSDAIIGVSRFSAQTIIDAGYPEKKVFPVLNALDLASERWNPGEKSDADISKAAVRTELGIPTDAPVIGVIARLFVYKGHIDLFNAVGMIVRDYPALRVVVVGVDDNKSHPGGGSFRAELQELAHKLGITKNIIFTGFRADIPQLMNSFDIYAMPSIEEPFGMVFVEAMAMRKPVVAWAEGGPLEIVVPCETGLLAGSRNVRVLADALAALVRDPKLREQYGEAGRRRVETHFTSARMCADVTAVYRTILGHARPLQDNDKPIPTDRTEKIEKQPGSRATTDDGASGAAAASPRAISTDIATEMDRSTNQ